MRNWQTATGGALWMLVACLMASAALQPVELAAASAPETVRTASLCAGDAAPACDTASL